jgi:hypothetical protein
MRILANHGSDPRFAFLRGRWSRTWRAIKNPPPSTSPGLAQKTGPAALRGLAGYGDGSDSEDEDSGQDKEVAGGAVDETSPITLARIAESRANAENTQESTTDICPSPVDVGDDAEAKAKAERRARAKLWTSSRKAGAPS